MNTPKLLHDDLDSRVTWANDWSLGINLSKSKVLHFGGDHALNRALTKCKVFKVVLDVVKTMWSNS